MKKSNFKQLKILTIICAIIASFFSSSNNSHHYFNVDIDPLIQIHNDNLDSILDVLPSLRFSNLYSLSATIDAAETKFYDENIGRPLAIKRSNYLSAKSALAYSSKDKKILFSKNPEEKIQPASLTKLFVIDYIYTIFNDNDVVNVDEDILSIVPEDSSVANLTPGKYYVSNLVAAMLVPSGNDAAYALCYAAASKLTEATTLSPQEGLNLFISYLDNYLKNEGYNDTSISNCSGFSYEDKSSCNDLLKVSIKLLENNNIKRIINSPIYYCSNVDGTNFEWINTNRCLHKNSIFYDQRITGFKTGSLDSIYNLISVIENDDEIILISLASPDNINRYYSNLYLMKEIGLDLSAEAAGIEITDEYIQEERFLEEQENLESLLPEIA